MNNVWNAIVHSGPCAARQTRSKPLLHLFNGYEKSQTARATRSQLSGAVQNARRSFSSAQNLYASRGKSLNAKRSAKAPSPSEFKSRLPASRLEPSQTVASHTEGVVAEEEQLTWRDYDPLGGMPLPNGERTQPEINAIFNSEEIDVDTGNYVLCVLHWRRESGALIDVGVEFPEASGVSKEMALKGLQYVRSVDPNVDEATNGEVWVQEESERLQQEIQDRAVKLGFYKAIPEEEEQQVDDKEARQQQAADEEQDRTSKSVLQSVREQNEARHEAHELARKAAEEKAKIAAVHSTRGPLELAAGVQPSAQVTDMKVVRSPFGGKITIRPPAPKAWLSQPVERKPWVKYYEEQAQIIKEHTIPNISSLQRFGPPFVVLLLVLGGCYYLSENYTPPPRSARIWPDTPPAVATIGALTSVLLWTFIMGRIPPLWRTYSKYMTLVPAYPYAVSLVGALFRHDTVAHLASNLVCLWVFGLLLHEDVGRGTFLAIYLASGVFGAYSSLIYNVFRKEFSAYILGSSGCVLGVFAAACALRPNGTIRVAGYDIPIAAWVFLALFGAAEAIAAIRGMKTRIDHAGHVGGILMGVASALYLRQKSQQQQMVGTSSLAQTVEKVKGDVKDAVGAS
ncbi:hypothetical protein M409DRAFT_18606 [Zasmidium cellare ATCC 36951]|uniref:Peptidase S54 rhomboid domain-containing protein n=1 Tax=Zasmidium cellare ATCC 36951 TaxID=1080233 RepID=A0A6A6D082_ZASCE|nr:uncharacterized protein M409DRAFT_18606 [Zasmidium cellare ATCC 36951]KAF2171489.1 hypothetical protein M409DRAFT_18606 [Zasmidium cellare ATCC 36951]